MGQRRRALAIDLALLVLAGVLGAAVGGPGGDRILGAALTAGAAGLALAWGRG